MVKYSQYSEKVKSKEATKISTCCRKISLKREIKVKMKPCWQAEMEAIASAPIHDQPNMEQATDPSP